jgi:hypothetical protein
MILGTTNRTAPGWVQSDKYELLILILRDKYLFLDAFHKIANSDC